jgi:Fe2+ transport system protein FeoA
LKVVFSFLEQTAVGVDVRVTGIELEASEVEWLQAVGLEEGAIVRVLRRAPLGGPLHVRSSTGSELAIHRSLARGVRVAKVPSVHMDGAQSSGGSSPAAGELTDLGPVSTA